LASPTRNRNNLAKASSRPSGAFEPLGLPDCVNQVQSNAPAVSLPRRARKEGLSACVRCLGRGEVTAKRDAVVPWSRSHEDDVVREVATQVGV
jgi:hypothetical protein